MSDSDCVVFCRLLFLKKQSATNQNHYCVKHLRDLVREAISPFPAATAHSSVYGRFVVIPVQPQLAIDLATTLMSAAAKCQVALSIGIAKGRIEQTHDVVGTNLAGKPINLAARLAHVQDRECRIAVEKEVVEYLRRADTRFENTFKKCQKTKVKRTEVQFHYMKDHFPEPTEMPGLGGGSRDSHVVAVDIVRYSEKSLAHMVDTAEGLLRHRVPRALEAAGGPAALLGKNALYYAPGGDGGIFVFDAVKSGGARAAWAFAKSLRTHCRGDVDIRIGIDSGPVVTLDDDYPVGTAILKAEELSGLPADGEICSSKAFWNCVEEDATKENWSAEPVSKRTDAFLLKDSVASGENPSSSGGAPPPGWSPASLARYGTEITNVLNGFPDLSPVNEIASELKVTARPSAKHDEVSQAISAALLKDRGSPIDRRIAEFCELRKRWYNHGRRDDVVRLDLLIDWVLPIRFDEESVNRLARDFQSSDVAIMTGTVTRAGTAVALSRALGGHPVLDQDKPPVKPGFRTHPLSGPDGERSVDIDGSLTVQPLPLDATENHALLLLKEVAREIGVDGNVSNLNDPDELAFQIQVALEFFLMTYRRLYYVFLDATGNASNDSSESGDAVYLKIRQRAPLLMFVRLNPNALTRTHENLLTLLLKDRIENPVPRSAP